MVRYIDLRRSVSIKTTEALQLRYSPNEDHDAAEDKTSEHQLDLGVQLVCSLISATFSITDRLVHHEADNKLRS